MKERKLAWLAAMFNGTGIGLLISPAFVPEMALWNIVGFVFLIPGIYFTNKAL